MNGHDLQSARARRCRFFELLRRPKLCGSGDPPKHCEIVKIRLAYKKVWLCDGTRCIIGLRFLLVL